MQHSTEAVVLSVLDIMRAVYVNQRNEITRKLENIEYINVEVLSSKIDKEFSDDDLSQNFGKIVGLVESIIQD